MIANKWGTEGKEKLFGVDYVQSALDLAKHLVPNGVFYKTLVHETGLKNESFDLIVAMELFEHVTEPAKVLDEAWRLLKPGGKLIITVPDGTKDNWSGHTNFWSEEEFRIFLQDYLPTSSNINVRRLNDGEGAVLAQAIKSKSSKEQEMKVVNDSEIEQTKKYFLLDQVPLNTSILFFRRYEKNIPRIIFLLFRLLPLMKIFNIDMILKKSLSIKGTDMTYQSAVCLY